MKKRLTRNLALLFFFCLCAFFLSNTGFTQAKQPCIFNGTINNVKVKSFKCDIVHDAGPSYLLIRLDFNGNYWMMDLSGVTKNQGKTNLNLVLKKHDGKNFSESYSGQTDQNLKASPKFPNLLGFFKSSIAMKDSNGKQISVTGDFIWDITGFPK
jgi:hypothetical protein